MKRATKRRTRGWWIVLVALGAVVMACGGWERPPGSGSIDGMELGLELRMHLTELAASDSHSPEPFSLCWSEIAGPEGALPEGFRVYTAGTEADKDGKAKPVTIAVAPLAGADPEARLAVAVDEDGFVKSAALWGDDAFDDDPDGNWRTYLRQFKDGYHVLDPEAVPTSEEVDAYWQALQSDDTAAAQTVRALYRHRWLMNENSRRVRTTMRRTAVSEVPSPDWFDEWSEQLRELAGLSPLLEPIVGARVAEEHRKIAAGAPDLLQPAREAAKAASPDEVREVVSEGFYKGTCKACHNIPDHPLGSGEFEDALLARLEDLGVRRDLFRVDYDVWAIPGRGDRSQHVADTLKCCLVALSGSPRDPARRGTGPGS